MIGFITRPTRIRRTRRFVTAFVAAAALASTSACSIGGGGGEAEGGTIRAAYAPTAAWLPVVIAAEKGIFEKNGLNVELTQVQNLDTTIGALDRQFDVIGQSSIAVARAADAGIDISVISGNTLETEENQQVAILVPADSPMTDFADLADASVGTPSLSGPIHVALLSAVLEAGADSSSIRGVEMAFPAMGDSLAAGTVEAVEHVQPFAGALLASGAVRNLGDPLLLASGGEPVVFTLWAANGSWAKDHPDEVKAWRDSLNEAIEYIAANDDEARAVLQEMTGLPAEIVAKVVLPVFDTEIVAEQVQTWLDIMDKVGEGVDVDAASLLGGQ